MAARPASPHRRPGGPGRTRAGRVEPGVACRPGADRVLDDSYPPVVRRGVATLTAARLATNAVYRFAPPFLATIARGLDVDLADLGVALAVTELAGLASPLVGRSIDRLPRRPAMVGGLVGIALGSLIVAASSGIVLFTVGLLVLGLTKVVFDVALISWTADHVPVRPPRSRHRHVGDVVGARVAHRGDPARARRRRVVVALELRRGCGRRGGDGRRRARPPRSGAGRPPHDVSSHRPGDPARPRRVGGRRQHARPDRRRPGAVRHVRRRGWRTTSASAPPRSRR